MASRGSSAPPSEPLSCMVVDAHPRQPYCYTVHGVCTVHRVYRAPCTAGLTLLCCEIPFHGTCHVPMYSTPKYLRRGQGTLPYPPVPSGHLVSPACQPLVTCQGAVNRGLTAQGVCVTITKAGSYIARLAASRSCHPPD